MQGALPISGVSKLGSWTKSHLWPVLFFIFMCMSVFPACMYAHHTQDLQRSLHSHIRIQIRKKKKQRWTFSGTDSLFWKIPFVNIFQKGGTSQWEPESRLSQSLSAPEEKHPPPPPRYFGCSCTFCLLWKVPPRAVVLSLCVSTPIGLSDLFTGVISDHWGKHRYLHYDSYSRKITVMKYQWK